MTDLEVVWLFTPSAAPSSTANLGLAARTVQAPQQTTLCVACQGALRKPPQIGEAAQGNLSSRRQPFLSPISFG